MFKFEFRTITGIGGAVPRLQVEGGVISNSHPFATVQQLTATLQHSRHRRQISVDPAPVLERNGHGHRGTWEANGNGSVIATMPITMRQLSAIEEIRETGKPPELAIVLTVRCAELHNIGTSAEPIRVSGATYDTARRHKIQISSEDWLRVLKECGYSETMVFELEATVLKKEQVTDDVLRLLQQAESAFRRGDWDVVMLRCKKAFELTAKLEAGSENKKKGFELLMSSAFPNCPDDRAEHLNALVRALNRFMDDAGRHAPLQFVDTTREEARFVLSTTLGVFDLLGRRLQRVRLSTQE